MLSNNVARFAFLSEKFLNGITADLFTDFFLARRDFARSTLFIPTSHYLGELKGLNYFKCVSLFLYFFPAEAEFVSASRPLFLL